MSRRIRSAPAPIILNTVTTAPQPQSRTPVTFTESDEPDGVGASSVAIKENLTLGVVGSPSLRPGLLSSSVTYATSSTQADPPDTYIDRLVKYIPSEIVALYLGVINVVPAEDKYYWTSLWIIAIVTTIITPIYMYFATSEKGEPTAWTQITASSIAFPIWVYATGGPFVQYGWYADKRWIAAVVLTFATFLIGIHKPDFTPAPAPTPDSTTTPPPETDSTPTPVAGSGATPDPAESATPDPTPPQASQDLTAAPIPPGSA